MANPVNKKKLVETLKALEKEYGEGSVYSLDSKKAIMQIPRWSTGLEDLDRIIGGGIPYGRIVEISGPESAGKTSLAYHLLAQHEVSVDIPVEGTFDAQRAKVFGNKKGQLIVRRAEYGEQCLESVMAFAEAGVPCIVIDSVPHMIPRKQFEEPDMEKENQLGRVAAMLSSNLPKIVVKCERTHTSLIFVNQMRDIIGGFGFGPKTHTPGGWALKHACSLRLQVNRIEWIKIPNKNPKNSAGFETVGIIMKVKVLKSKVCNPLGECVLSMFFDRGFVPNDETKAIRQEIMTERNRKLREARAKAKSYEEDEEDDDE
ncbi:MAG: ATPase domain-containing protein [Peptostreptococcales bacterium]